MKPWPTPPLGILLLIATAVCAAEPPGIVFADSAAIAAPSQCAFHRSINSWTGSCGAVFDEMPVFVVTRAKAVTTGNWRQGPRPKAVWAGVLKGEGEPDYPIEIEVYDGGGGVLRSEFGWFAISGFSSGESGIHFKLETSREVAPGPLDLAILKRANEILRSVNLWNREDDRKCAAGAARFSIYCATEQATIEITGGFHHRRPALQLVRQIVDERSKGRNYDHRLMDYNNDPSTTLADVHSLFAEAERRVPK